MELNWHRMKATVLALPALLTACAVGPDYVRPKVDAPAAFKEMEGWKTAQPRDHEVRGKWWEAFNDPLLNLLVEQVSISNQNLVEAEARFRQAQALIQSARAGYFPTVSASVSSTRFSGDTRNKTTSSSVPNGTSNNHSLSIDASWEADVWGRVRRSVESTQSNAQASAADLESTRLSAQAALAQNYFQLRTLDAQQKLLDDTVAAYEKSLLLTQNQYAVGVAPKANVILAQSQLKTTQAQAIDIGVQRAQLEHAIALLVGKPASTFSIARMPLMPVELPVPLSVPSALLERR